jgi:hypothetical protein
MYQIRALFINIFFSHNYGMVEYSDVKKQAKRLQIGMKQYDSNIANCFVSKLFVFLSRSVM